MRNDEPGSVHEIRVADFLLAPLDRRKNSIDTGFILPQYLGA
jgi:hypothetical protein